MAAPYRSSPRRPDRRTLAAQVELQGDLGVAGGRAYKIGAFEAMGEGTVDVNWAKKHHRPWVEEQLARAANETRGQPTATLKE
jgi:hypothetical protein